MNDAIFWRLVWKEYRLQRGFWLSIVMLAIAAQLIPLAYVAVRGESFPVWVLYAVAMAAAALYALGCGATLFATEHEAGTFDFQRALPVSAGNLFAGKLAYGLASTLALQLTLWLITIAVARGALPEASRHWELWAAGLVAAVELLAWGVLFSLLLKQPLAAAVLAVAAASVVVHAIVPNLVSVPYSEFGLNNYLALLPLRPVLSILILVADLGLANRWVAEPARSGSRPRRAKKPAAAPYLGSYAPIYPALPRSVVEYGRAVSRSTGRLPRSVVYVGRLVWQEWRQSWRLIATLCAIYVCLATVSGDSWMTPARPLEVTAPVAWLLPLAWIMGSCVFLADQRHARFRFFAEQGLRPRWVWFSRNLVWLGSLSFWVIVAVGLAAFAGSAPTGPGLPRGLWPALCLVVLICYAVGQTCSLFFRSWLLAVTFAAGLSSALAIWSIVMAELRANLLICVVPIPIALLWASWLRAPDWLTERTGWRARLRAAASLVVPAAAIFVAVVLYRSYEYPLQDPGFSVAEFTRPATADERETADRYRRAWESVSPPPTMADGRGERFGELAAASEYASNADLQSDKSDVARWVDEHDSAINEALDASRRPHCLLYDPERPEKVRLPSARRLAALLFCSGVKLECQGEPAKALDRYLAVLRFSRHLRIHGGRVPQWMADDMERLVCTRLPLWAVRGEQSSSEILKAREAVQKIWRDLPPRSDAIKSCYLRQMAWLSSIEGLNPEAPDHLRNIIWIRRLAPSELHRAGRLLNIEVRRQLQLWESLEACLRPGGAQAGNVWLRQLPSADQDSDPALGSMVDDGYLFWSGPFEGGEELRRETVRRATCLVLALQAWQVDHGRLPDSLDQLTGAYLDKVPVAPDSGSAFVYVPHGDPQPPESVAAGQPFVASRDSDASGCRGDVVPYLPVVYSFAFPIPQRTAAAKKPAQ